MSAEKANILVVDDLPEKLLVYRSILDELGQNVITALTGAEALKQILQHDFAVILLDVNMPDMDGFETAALIRRRKRSAHTPIIFVTALVDELRAVQGYALGAVDYILSPVVPEILRAKVKVFVDLFHMHQQVKQEAEMRVALAEEQAKRAAAEEANRASAFLARASTVLANSMFFEATVRGLAHVAVPFLADLCVVCLNSETGQANQSEWAWTDGIEVVQPFTQMPRPAGWLVTAMARVFTSGKYEIVASGPSPVVSITSQDERSDDPRRDEPKEHRRSPDNWPTEGLWPLTPVSSAVVLPLTARGKTLGTLSLILGPSGRRYEPNNIGLAQDLASRAGIALDNALLVRNIQQADRRKDEFLAMLAHELRNPLAPICNAVQIMRLQSAAQPELLKVQDVIDRQLRNLTRLVDDLLDVARITSGKIPLKLDTVDVADAVALAVESSRLLIESRKQELTLLLAPEPIKVRADQTRLAQVLSNLLNNAAKYTPKGGRIWLSTAAEGNEAVIRVRDNGNGIAADMLPCIFDLFTQADQSLERSEGGLGIGLTLVRRLVELHQGSVQAFSKGPGHGSEFVVQLPILELQKKEEKPEMSQEPPATPAPNGHPKSPLKRRILVVDDNADTAESLAMLMRIDGHDVRTAHDGLAALQAFTAFAPQVVLLDIGLPHLDGYEVARRLRHQPEGRDVLLAALTGYGNEEDRERCELAGFDHHLVKPVRLEALRQILA